jgi:hypothetical protein
VRGLSGSRFRWHNAYVHACTRAFELELYCAGSFGKQGVILAHADVFTSMVFGATLTDENVASQYYLAAEAFDTKAFGL